MMPVRARLVSDFIVEFSRLDMGLLSKQAWRSALIEAGEELQVQIADSFEAERVAGVSQLVRNTPQWNRYKLRHGLDSRRGHATGMLQSVLDGDALFRVSAITVNKKGLGRARVHFLENRLHARVPHAEYYEEAKVRRRGILALARSWLDGAVAILRAREVQAAIRQRRGKERSRIRNPNIAANVAARAGRIIRRIG